MSCRMWQRSLRVLFVVGCLVSLRGTHSLFFEVASPWTWVCDSTTSQCVKMEKTDLSSTGQGSSLAQCKLTCDQVANLWPRPRGSVKMTNLVASFLWSNVKFTKMAAPTQRTTDLLREASDIFSAQIQNLIPASVAKLNRAAQMPYKAAEHLVDIEVVTTDNDTRLTLQTDESYTLQIETVSTTTSVYIVAPTFFGARHALETLSQLMVWDEDLGSLILLKDVSIEDSPFYPHRGLLIDTTRNYFSVATIKRVIDAMSYNKLNVLHWHLTDSQSFPFVSKRQPLMALYGAYSSAKVYSPEDVQDIVHYATVRGVKVLPELDVPSHVGSGWQWGPKYNLGELAMCINKQPWDTYCYEPPCGILNPINDNVYSVLGDIYRDMSELFQSDVFHIGGDEVIMTCWNESKPIVDWLASHGRGQTHEDFLYLWSHFQNRSLAELDEAYGHEQPVMLWTNSFTDTADPDRYLDPARYIIQVWSESTAESIKVLYEKNFKLILSTFDLWYLDCGYGAWVGDGINKTNNWCSPYKGWQTVYNGDPKRVITDFGLTFNKDQMLGGEAALWTEQTEGPGIEGKLWPRGAALAERLWTDPSTDAYAAETRMVHHRQRLVDRGIMADGVQPEWCHQNAGECPGPANP